MDVRRFEVPGEPVGKGRPRFRSQGHYVWTYTDKKTRDYENLIEACYQNAHRDKPALTGPVGIQMEFVMPVRKSWTKKKQAALRGQPFVGKPDLDNLIKIVLDGLNGMAFEDDKQIVELSAASRYQDYDDVRAIIYIYGLEALEKIDKTNGGTFDESVQSLRYNIVRR